MNKSYKGYWFESKMHRRLVYVENKTPRGRRCDVYGWVRGWHINITLYMSPCRASNYYIDVLNVATFERERVSATWLAETFPEMFALLKRRAGIRMYKGV